MLLYLQLRAEVPASGFWLLKNASFAILTLCHDKNPWDKIHVNWHVMIWCPEMTHSCNSFKFLRNLIKWCHIQQCQYTTAADKKPCPSKSSLELGCCLNTKGRLAGYCVGDGARLATGGVTESLFSTWLSLFQPCRERDHRDWFFSSAIKRCDYAQHPIFNQS